MKNKLFTIIFFALISPGVLFSQGLPGGGGGEGSRVEKTKFLPLPYINYDRSIGFTIGALPMVQFNPVKKDTISPSAIVGALGMYTTNDTWFVMGFGAFYFDEDNWRVQTAGGLGSINFQFYLNNPINEFVPYNTQADFFYLGVQRRIVNRIYGGISYVFASFATSTEIFPNPVENKLNGIGLSASIDERSNVYYPRKGFYSTLRYFTFPSAFGNENANNKIQLDFNQYFSARSNTDVIAARAFAGLGIGDLTFNQQFIVGNTDIRGYSQGAFRGNYLLSLQGEYRWNFYKRWGAVGYFGLATVFESINSEDNGKILPGIGTGIRFVVSQDTRMNIGMDIAAGVDDWGIYFRIGEAF